MKTTGTLLLAFLVAVLGYFAAQYAIGETMFATQAGTAGSVLSMALFFGVSTFVKGASDGMEVRQKLREMKLGAEAAPRTKEDKSIVAIAQKGLGSRGEAGMSKAKALLVRAGLYQDKHLFAFMLWRWIGAAAGIGFAAFYALGRQEGPVAAIMLVAAGGLIGHWLPTAVVKSKVKARKQKLLAEFPDAIDLIVIHVESGASFDAAMTKAMETMSERYPTISMELRLLAYELRYSTDRKRAFEALATRCDVDIARRMVAIVEQSESVGSSISEGMKALAKDGRTERLYDAERKAAKIPILMQIPVVFFILPSLFLFVLGPAAIKILDAFRALHA